MFVADLWRVPANLWSMLVVNALPGFYVKPRAT